MDNIKIDEKFFDENTGETVARIKVPDDLSKNINDYMVENSKVINNFLNLSRQIVVFTAKQKEEFDRAVKFEHEINKEVLRIREKIGLDSGWIYNLHLKIFEQRTPPPETKVLGDVAVNFNSPTLTGTS